VCVSRGPMRVLILQQNMLIEISRNFGNLAVGGTSFTVPSPPLSRAQASYP
jgi:hypothetical protein